MEAKINYDRMGTEILAGPEWSGRRPSLLLHSCCAPCSTAALERLCESFDVTVLYYNPNIFPRQEFEKRLSEQRRLLSELPASIGFLGSEYRPEEFFDAVHGLESAPEGGERCRICFRLRLERCARLAAENGFDFFTTTLTLSPLKDAQLLNRLGIELGEKHGVPFFPSDFKKRDGYLRSLALSRQYGLYRQDYCGCVYSRRRDADQTGSDGAPE